MTQLRITQTGSTIGNKPKARATMRALGLRRIHQTVVKDDTPEIRGMVQRVRHLVDVEEVR